MGKEKKIKKQKQRSKPVEAGKTNSAEKQWFKIDNAGLIYIPASNRRWTAVFRVACALKSEIDPVALQQAVNDLFPRFPSLMVHIKSGLFWNYLETAPNPPKIIREELYPCRNFEIKSGKFAVRILYSRNRIIFEPFHVITDGGGASKYLLSLVRRYIEIKENKELDSTGCLDYRDLPVPEETEDSFMRYAFKGKGKRKKERKRLKLKFEKGDYGVYNVIHGEFSLKQMKEVTKKLGCTVGEFIAAGLFYSLNLEAYKMASMPPDKYPIRMAIPINLRRRFKSETLRNFSTFINIEIEHGKELTFEQILKLTKEQFALINDEYIQSNISANVTSALNPFVRAMPTMLKNLFLSVAYSLFGEKRNNLAFSNLGPVATPKEFSEYVDRVEFFLGPPRSGYFHSTAVCFEDKLLVSITSICKNVIIEKTFFKLMSSFGLDICVDSNRRECNE